jgi:hypothetical protein
MRARLLSTVASVDWSPRRLAEVKIMMALGRLAHLITAAIILDKTLNQSLARDLQPHAHSLLGSTLPYSVRNLLLPSHSGYPVFPRGESGQAVVLTTHPF